MGVSGKHGGSIPSFLWPGETRYQLAVRFRNVHHMKREEKIAALRAQIEHYEQVILPNNITSRWYDQGRRYLVTLKQELEDMNNEVVALDKKLL